MGLASNQARLNVLTIRKADLEYRLTSIMMQNQRLATEMGELVAQKADKLTNYIANKTDDSVEFTETQDYADYETAMAQLEAAQARLDQEQETLDTQHQQIEAEEEQIQKLVDSNIKSSFGYFN